MKLGTSVRFLFPTSPDTHERFRSLLASMPKGAFIERPMGAYTPDEQARNLMDVAAAARAAGLDALLTGDSHGAQPGLRRHVLAAAHRRAPDERDRRHADRRGPARPVLSPGAAGRADRHARRVRPGPADRDLRAGRPPAAVRRLRHGGDEPRGPPRGSGGDHARAPGRRARHPPRPLLHAGGRHDQPAAARAGGDLARRDGAGVGPARRADGRRLADRPERDRRGAAAPARPLPRGGDARRAPAAAGPAPRHLRRASPTRRRAPSSAPSWPRAIAAPASTSSSWAARTPSSRACAATERWASTT